MIEAKQSTIPLESGQDFSKYLKEKIEKSLNKNEPEWLKKHRLEALSAYSVMPLPDRVRHRWKYLDPALFDLISDLTITNKFNYYTNISKSEADTLGIVFDEMKNLFSGKAGEIVRSKISSIANPNSSRITMLNDTLWLSGFFLYVPKGVKIDKPIITKMVMEESNTYSAVRCLIIMEEDSSVNLTAELASNNSENIIVNSLYEIVLGANAKLNLLNLESLNNANKVRQYTYQKTKVNEGAQFINLLVSLGGDLTKTDLDIDLNKENASATVYGIVLGNENQKFDSHTAINHLAPNTKSLLNFRVVLKDKARSAYTGNLKIIKEAIKSDARQENRNLLLSEQAIAESIPELEILTNDVVQCNHGVTVGQIDKDQIFYLMSRGLSYSDAEKIIVEGFFEPTMSRIADNELYNRVSESILSKLVSI